MKQRVVGFDVARALAIFGMVLLNYKVVMDASTGNEFLLWFTGLLEGRASALFVMLAGVGVTFLTNKARLSQDKSFVLTKRLSLVKRGGALIVIGLLYIQLWDGDILLFYGFYFLIAAAIFMLSDKSLLLVATVVVLVFPVLMLLFNYDQSWDWNTLDYEDLWTLNGMFRNVMFNGFYPIFPWSAFLIFGMWLGRQDLQQTKIRNKFLVWSLLILTVTEAGFYLVRVILSEGSATGVLTGEAAYLFSTSVMPPLPQYVLSAGSSATIVLIGSLYFSEWFSENKITGWLYQTGQLSLTLYIAHVAIGMEILGYIGRLDNQTIDFSVFSAIVFCIGGVLFSVLWLKYFKTGPLEWCFRKISN